jgi:resuscitation-promoting factor RpfA
MSDMQISPLAKRLAEENSIDWQRIKGTGPEGRVIERDILTYLARIMSGEADLPVQPDLSEPPPPAGVPDLGQVSNLAAASAGLAKEGVDLNALLAPPSNSSSFSNMPPLDLGATGGFAPETPAPTPSAYNAVPELVTEDSPVAVQPPMPPNLVIENLPSAPSFDAPSFDAPTFTPPSFEPPATEAPSAFAAPAASSVDDDAVFELDLDDFDPEVVEETAVAAPVIAQEPVSAFESTLLDTPPSVPETTSSVAEVHPHEVAPLESAFAGSEAPAFESAFEAEPQLEVNNEVFTAPLDLGAAKAAVEAPVEAAFEALVEPEPTFADIPEPVTEPEPVSAFQTVLQPIAPVFEDARAPEAFVPAATEPVVEALEMSDEDIIVDLDEPEVAAMPVSSVESMPELVAVQTEEPVLLQDDDTTPVTEPEPIAMEDAPLLIPIGEIAAPLTAAGLATAALHHDSSSDQYSSAQHNDAPVVRDFFNLYAARRQFDSSALSAISQQLSNAMNHQAVPLEVFLGRAASRASHLLGASTSVSLARLESHGLQALETSALDHGFVDAVRSVAQAQPTEAHGLMVVDASSIGADDLVLPAPGGVLALGRLHNGHATLTLSGNLSPRQSTEFLDKVAEYLENPVSLVI